MNGYDEILAALLSSHAAARTAGHAARRTVDVDSEVAELKAEVAALQRTVAALVALLDEAGIDGAPRLRERVLAAARRERETLAEDAPAAEVLALASAGSPYRGVSPRAFARTCARCGKELEADDPELTLPNRGGVCLGCYQRAG